MMNPILDIIVNNSNVHHSNPNAAGPPPVCRPIHALPLSPELRARLLSIGIEKTSDISSYTPINLAREAQISNEEAMEVLRVSLGLHSLDHQLEQGTRSGMKTAGQLLEQQSKSRRIITFCGELDKILGGGVAVGQITEFCGLPGLGKTQIGIQLCIDVQIPKVFGGLGGEAIYIDTEGSFTCERAEAMAQAAVKHVAQLTTKRPQFAQDASGFNLDKVLSGIHYFRIHSAADQAALVTMLPAFIKGKAPNVRLVVMDSITFHFRQDFGRDMALRTRVLLEMAMKLMSLAEEHQLAVVLMNQVTTKINEATRESQLVPALGESWGHCASTRLILQWRAEERFAHVYKSPYLPPASARFFVVEEGIRGPPTSKKKRALPQGEGEE